MFHPSFSLKWPPSIMPLAFVISMGLMGQLALAGTTPSSTANSASNGASSSFAVLNSSNTNGSNEARPLAQDPVVEKRLIAISSELRCLVCQNESLVASQADLAVDLRNQIRELIIDNKTDQEILNYLTSRYGDFVLYRPPFKPLTWALWTAPAILVVLGLWILFRRIRKKSNLAPSSLHPDEVAKAQSLLNDR